MVKRIIWSPQAVADRLSVLDYWHQRIGNKNYSIKLDKSLKHIVKMLVQYPSMGRQLKNVEERYFVKDNYMIFYTDNLKSIEILHIWDTRRNPDELIFDL